MEKEEVIKIAKGLRTDFKCESSTIVDFCNTIIKELEQEPKIDRVEYGTDGNAYRLTISNGKELKQEPFINKPCVSSGVCEHDKQKMLEKIGTEIEQKAYPIVSSYNKIDKGITLYEVLEIIDKYREVRE